MFKRSYFIALALLMIPLLLSGCVDKKKIESIEETQKEILAKLTEIEKNQKEMGKFYKPRRPTVDYNKVHNLPVGSSAIKGSKEARVTIVEFSDFQCPYCSRVQSTLREVLKAYPDDVKLVYKDFPLSFHKQAKNAARAARAAGEQGKYWEMHDMLFENYNRLTDDKFKEFATKLNLDLNKFMTDFNSNKYDKLIQEDIDLGRKAGVTGTPTLFINGKRMQRRSVDDFKTTIDGYLKNKG